MVSSTEDDEDSGVENERKEEGGREGMIEKRRREGGREDEDGKDV